MKLFLIVVLAVGLLLVGVIGMNYNNVTENYGSVLSYEYQLMELDRVNKLLGVDPDDLADPRSRSVSQQARDFVIKERIDEGVNKW